MIGLQTDSRMNGFAQDRRGVFFGDFFDFHAARGAGHEDDASGSSIHEKTKIELALNVQIPAVVSGAVDALIAIEPMGSMAIAAGDVEPVVVNVGAKYVTNPWFGGGAAITTKFVKERPEVARRVLLVLREATDKIQANFDQYRPLLAKYVGVPEGSLPVVKKLVFRNERDVNETDLKSMQNVLDMFYREKLTPTHLSINDKFLRLDDIK